MAQEGIAILAYGPSWRLCPYDKETWGINYIYQYPGIKRMDKVFDVHGPESMARYHGPKGEDLKRAKEKYGCEIITAMELEAVETTPYPIWEICEYFKIGYLNNIIPFVLAYAIWKDVPSIDLWGVDLADRGTARLYQKRACIEYWCGRAQGRGIDINVSKSSSLCKDELYWRSDEPDPVDAF